MQKKLILAAVVLASAACGVKSPYMKPNASPVGAAPSDSAQIVFVRPLGGPLVSILDSQGHYVGDSLPESHFAVTVPPGEHTFVAWSEGTHAMKANVAAGKTYYVEVLAVPGVWGARFHLKAIKSSLKSWPKLEDWMKKTMPHEVMQADGQAKVVDAKKAKADETIAKGLQVFSKYDQKEADERTLAPSDGV
jgi:hypothetical protein